LVQPPLVPSISRAAMEQRSACRASRGAAGVQRSASKWQPRRVPIAIRPKDVRERRGKGSREEEGPAPPEVTSQPATGSTSPSPVVLADEALAMQPTTLAESCAMPPQRQCDSLGPPALGVGAPVVGAGASESRPVCRRPEGETQRLVMVAAASEGALAPAGSSTAIECATPTRAREGAAPCSSLDRRRLGFGLTPVRQMPTLSAARSLKCLSPCTSGGSPAVLSTEARASLRRLPMSFGGA